MPDCIFTAGDQCGDGKRWATCRSCGFRFCAIEAHIPTIQRANCGEAAKAQAQATADMPHRESPGFLEKVKNFAAAAASHVAAGAPMATDEEILRRHDICLQCEHLANNVCSQCGCPVSRVKGYISKLSWADQECPVGKWGKSATAG